MKDKLSLTLNAQFFVPKKQINAADIKAIVDAATGNAADNELVHSEFRIERRAIDRDFSYKYSLSIFKTERQVYFLTESDLKDKIYGFILLLEFENHLVVLRKSSDNIYPAVEKNFDLLSSDKLTSIFDDDLVDFQKISIRNMTVSDKAIRSRSYEAVDLKGALSSHAAGRSIPYFLRLRNGASLTTMSLNAGRVHEASARRSLDQVALWAGEVISRLNARPKDKNFLNSFAKKVELSNVLSKSKPAALLIECGALKDKIDNDDLVLIYKNKLGRTIPLRKGKIEKLYKELEEVYEIDPKNLNMVHNKYVGHLVLNSKSITLRIRTLGRLYIRKNGKDELIQGFISKHGFFSICFTDPKFMYFMGECFEDVSGVAEIKNLLKLMVPLPSLKNVTSEKGVVTAASKSFDRSSVFDAVEKHHANDTYLFCDDLGDEWADHISLNIKDSCVAFIHSKHGEVSRSASNMHDVVGQAIKNLGNMFFDSNRFIAKHGSKLKDTYSGTKISRCRKGRQKALVGEVEKILADHRLHRKCILACSFLSKRQITTEFNKIASGKTVKGNILQLLWIISSFSHASKDAAVVPVIYCRP